MKRRKISKHFLIVFLFLCTALAAGFLIQSQTVMATATPIRGIGVVIKKIPGDNSRSATTGDDGTFTIGNLGPGNYTVSMKLTDYSPPENLTTAIIEIRGVKGGRIVKKISITDLQRGVTFDIEIAGRSAGTIVGRCMATDKPVR